MSDGSISNPEVAIREIRSLVHRYADAVVHRNTTRWASTWTSDARWCLSEDRIVHGRDAIVALWTTSMQQFDMVVQLVHNGTATVDGLTASGTWYVTEHYRRTDGSVGILLAYYDDEYTLVDNGWLFASRALRRVYQGPPDLSGVFAHPGETSPTEIVNQTVDNLWSGS